MFERRQRGKKEKKERVSQMSSITTDLSDRHSANKGSDWQKERRQRVKTLNHQETDVCTCQRESEMEREAGNF